MNCTYYISGKLQNGGLFENKEYFVCAKNKKEADKKIKDCLSFDDKIKEWHIRKTKITDEAITIKNGVWYKPFKSVQRKH